MHGGDIYSSEVKYDFSVNVNPLGIPEGVKRSYLSAAAVDSICCYPDMECRELRHRLASELSDRYESSILPEQLVCGNGASELIMALAGALKVKKALLPVPCFTGYEKALKACGAEKSVFYLKEEKGFQFDEEEFQAFLVQLETVRPELVTITNPNNPNGLLVHREIVEKTAAACESLGAVLLLDECFMELTGKGRTESFLPLVNRFKNVVVLRAFTKTFALPGLRLGYAVCSDEKLLSEIKAHLPEWNVSSVSQMCGLACLEEKEYLKRSVDLINEEKIWLQQKLKLLGFTVYESDTDFLLFKSGIKDLKERLMERGILIRDCSDYEGLEKGFCRVAVKTRNENEILDRNVTVLLKG